MITGETVTTDQIDSLWRSACGTGLGDVDPDTMHACTVASNRSGDFSAAQQREARDRVAAVLTARLYPCMNPSGRGHVSAPLDDVCLYCGKPRIRR